MTTVFDSRSRLFCILESLSQKFKAKLQKNMSLVRRRFPPPLEKRENIVEIKDVNKPFLNQEYSRMALPKNRGCYKNLQFLVTTFVHIFTERNERPLLKLFAFCHKGIIQHWYKLRGKNSYRLSKLTRVLAYIKLIYYRRLSSLKFESEFNKITLMLYLVLSFYFMFSTNTS